MHLTHIKTGATVTCAADAPVPAAWVVLHIVEPRAGWQSIGRPVEGAKAERGEDE